MMRFTTFFAVIVFANASGLYSLGDLSSYALGDGSLSRQEIRSPDGIVRGTLTYIDGDGKIKSISYGGDNDIETQKASTETPMTDAAATATEGEGDREREQQQQQQSEDAPKESEEMKEETVDASSSENNQNQTASTSSEDNGENGSNGQVALPQPVSYTPEVAAARAAHFAARDQAILLQQLAANQEQLEANQQQQLLNQQQQLLNQQQILEYPPIFREYYGAAKPLKTINPYYYL